MTDLTASSVPVLSKSLRHSPSSVSASTLTASSVLSESLHSQSYSHLLIRICQSQSVFSHYYYSDSGIRSVPAQAWPVTESECSETKSLAALICQSISIYSAGISAHSKVSAMTELIADLSKSFTALADLSVSSSNRCQYSVFHVGVQVFSCRCCLNHTAVSTP